MWRTKNIRKYSNEAYKINFFNIICKKYKIDDLRKKIQSLHEQNL